MHCKVRKNRMLGYFLKMHGNCIYNVTVHTLSVHLLPGQDQKNWPARNILELCSGCSEQAPLAPGTLRKRQACNRPAVPWLGCEL